MKNRLTGGERPLSPRYGYVILVLMCLGIAMPSFAQYQIAGFGKEAIASYLGTPLDDRAFSTLNMATFLPGIIFSLISGLMVDRFGTRRVVVSGVVLAALGIVLRAFVVGYASIWISMFLMGVCTTFYNANGAKILGSWFEPAKAGLLLGVFMGFTNVAMSFSTGMTAIFPTVRSAFLTAVGIAVVVTILCAALMRDNTARRAAEERVSIAACLRICVKSRGVWLAALGMSLLTTSCVGLIQFIPTALQYRGVAPQAASLCGMCVTLGATAGCLLVPILSRRLRRVKLWLSVCGVLAAALVAFAWSLASVPLTAAALFAAGFLTSGLGPLVMAIPLQLPEIGPRYAGTAGGFVSTVQLVGNTLLPTYVITAIAGNNNYGGMFLCFGSLMLFFAVLSFFLPLKGKKE